ncbi:pseudouridine synthase [Saccharospirillum impatiens]|uniref:pseudouridine synthase n=1 Tax=Saccharospirillum impatiens TaxID=169438 RepID=UPI00041768E7|nr:16S rRNA pseudouridine(516) synthase [Saccharospirillum impatiens]
MHSKRSRLDRFIARTCQVPLKAVKPLLARGLVCVNGTVVNDAQWAVDEFDLVVCDGVVLQERTPLYFMLHKPVGVVSATRDAQHTTVLDLIDHPDKESLHIVGRLDLNTSGLVLLTNDGRWSRALTSPEGKVPKRYQVRVTFPLDERYVKAFAEGFYFETEGVVTAPATLTLTSATTAELVLTEGKYHQVKRMFGRFRNPVLALHRTAVGPYVLDDTLAPGEFKPLVVPRARLHSG